jgi:glycosyltransferase involved in cell wall biosynthesis
MCGLPGKAYHGGAVTCWSVLHEIRRKGIEVELISIFDEGSSNPYLNYKNAQINQLKEIGISVELLSYKFEGDSYKKYLPKKIVTLLQIFKPKLSDFFPWANLTKELATLINKKKFDMVFIYHFDALSAVYGLDCGPKLVGVGDLWHVGREFAWNSLPSGVKKYTVELLKFYSFKHASISYMKKMLLACDYKGAYAAHYAAWFRDNGVSDMQYFRTPSYDSCGNNWRNMRSLKINPEIYKILMIGDFGTTSTSSGLKELGAVIYHLDRSIGDRQYELHILGGGEMPTEMLMFKDHPAIKIRGRIYPPDDEFLSSDVLFVPTPISVGIRVRIISGMSFGSCVVTHHANSSGIPELQHGVNCLMGGSAEELGRCLEKLGKNSALRDKLSAGARLTYENNFSESMAMTSIFQIIDTKKSVGYGI